MSETHPKSSPESIQTVKDMFTLDPANNQAIINEEADMIENEIYNKEADQIEKLYFWNNWSNRKAILLK